MNVRACAVLLGVLAAGIALGARGQELETLPTPLPLPSGPLVTLRLEVEQTELHVGDFLGLRVFAVNNTPHGLIRFVPPTTIRVSTWPKGWRDQSIVDQDFIASIVMLVPAGNRYVWGSADSWWSPHVLQMTWDPGDYHLRYCMPLGGKILCSNTVEITLDP